MNTCPVGIATQDPELRRKFTGQPEHVINFFFMMAEEVREHMAALGFRRFSDMVGHVELLEAKVPHSIKTSGLDLSSMLVTAASLNPSAAQTNVEKQDHQLGDVLDRKILARISDRLASGERIKANHRISNTDRAVGAILSHTVTRLHGLKGLPDDTVHLRFKGSAGQSFGAWLAPGLTMELNGDSNDYVGKGLSGGRLIIYPPKESLFKSEDNVIVGNVVLYGATAGSAFFRGRALQRFCVRNSGANAVVEGVGDHGCEYMTGGIVVILGSTGRNFAAGMSGGIAYVWDPKGQLDKNANRGLVQLEALDDKEDSPILESLIDQHRLYTGSSIADRILWNWSAPIDTHPHPHSPTDTPADVCGSAAVCAQGGEPALLRQGHPHRVQGHPRRRAQAQAAAAAPAEPLGRVHQGQAGHRPRRHRPHRLQQPSPHQADPTPRGRDEGPGRCGYRLWLVQLWREERLRAGSQQEERARPGEG